LTAASDHLRIEALIRRWLKAVREGSRTALRADHDAAMLLFDVGPTPHARGIESYMRRWETFFSAWAELQTFECNDLTITNGLDVAFATAIARCSGLAANGRAEVVEFRLTLGLCKVDGRWRVLHEHHSLPSKGALPFAGTTEAPHHEVPTLDRPALVK
jgi:ketosteroid isomerase-like protein